MGIAAPGIGSEAVAEFESVRDLLFRIAHRTLGHAADAEDVVQDVWVRWQGVDRARVRDRVAFLVTVTTRSALNAATSARARREVSAGAWGAEAPGASVDPEREAERGEELEFAVRLLVERLSPVERAVYVLREAFEYPFREIADLLGLSEANARQLAVRARRRVAVPRQGPVVPGEGKQLLEVFRGAARNGDLVPLTELLLRGLR
ncbi:sigma-70 family RNA polymerase sigma factor [Actinocorallia libanotica]